MRPASLYLKQITTERRAGKIAARLSRSSSAKTDLSRRSGAKTDGRVSYFWKQVRRDSHLGDCGLMIIVAAVITKTLQVKSMLQ
ncbi:MAG: hypothetical protein ABSE16_08755 [Verrucomicrobiota bacterium]